MAKKKPYSSKPISVQHTNEEVPEGIVDDKTSRSKVAEFRNRLLPPMSLYVEALIIFLIGFVWYANSLGNGYAVDDFDVIIGNESVQGGIKYIPNILKNDEKAGKPVTAEEVNLFAGGRYRPLSLVMFAVEKSLSGENSPILGHFMNVLLYAITLVIWWWVFRKYCFPKTPEIAFLTMALFAIHPVHTEVVANIKSRDEILCLFFLGFMMLFTFRAIEKPFQKMQYLILGSVMYFFALLSRETAFTFLLILPMTLFFFGKLFYKNHLSTNRILQFSGIVLSCFVIYFMIRYKVLSQYKDMPFYDDIRNYRDELNDPFIHASFLEKYATIFFLLLKYLVMLFYPHPLSWDYSYPEIAYRSWGSPEVYLALIINGGLLLYAFYRLPKRDPMSYAILFYFLSMSIVSNVFFNIGVAFAERFLFLPSLGWAMAIAILIYRGINLLPSIKPVALGLLGMVAVMAFVKTFARNKQWESHEILALADVKTCPKSAKTNINAGDVYMIKARTTSDIPQQMQYLDSARKYYKITRDILPQWYNADSGYKTASLALGKIYYDKAKDNDMKNGPMQTTMDYLEKAAASAPMWGSPRMMMSVFYETRLQDTAKAYAKIKEAASVAPDSIQYWYRWGQMAFSSKRYEEAVIAFEHCAKMRPNDPNVWFDFAIASLQAGQIDRAKNAFMQVKALDPKRILPPQAEAVMK